MGVQPRQKAAAAGATLRRGAERPLDDDALLPTADAVDAVLKAFPHASVMVRAYDRLHLIQLDKLDLTFAERELFESAVAMGRAALKASGIEAAEIDRVEREYRSRDCERLERQAETGDIKAGWDRAFTPDRSLPDEEARSPA